jgi:hypothetical protein
LFFCVFVVDVLCVGGGGSGDQCGLGLGVFAVSSTTSKPQAPNENWFEEAQRAVEATGSSERWKPLEAGSGNKAASGKQQFTPSKACATCRHEQWQWRVLKLSAFSESESMASGGLDGR